MLKTLMATAVAITGFANIASADVSHCGFEHSRFNPSSLSEYQECWLDVYKADETHGVLGSLFWVKVADQYYSTTLTHLRNHGAEAWLNSVNAEIIHVELNEKESELTQTIETIKKVEKIVEVLVEVEVPVEVIVEKVVEITKEIEIPVEVIVTEIIDNTDYTTITELEAELDAISEYKESIAEMTNEEIVKSISIPDANAAEKIVSDPDLLAVNNYTNAVLNGIKHKITAGEYATFQIVIDQFIAASYVHGYDDGYKDGYADGFKDGVASVTN